MHKRRSEKRGMGLDDNGDKISGASDKMWEGLGEERARVRTSKRDDDVSCESWKVRKKDRDSKRRPPAALRGVR